MNHIQIVSVEQETLDGVTVVYIEALISEQGPYAFEEEVEKGAEISEDEAMHIVASQLGH